MPALVRISDIGLYLHCPRRVYFEVLAAPRRRSDPMQLLLRGLMLEISDGLSLEDELREGLKKLEQELPLVHDIDPRGLRSACIEVEAMIAEMARGLSNYIDLLIPSEIEVDLRSDRLCLTGRLDRLVTKGRAPSIIRTGTAPGEGVWKRDRLMLAGYALLLEEKYGARVERGLVEYPRAGVVREVEIHGIDRGRALRIRDRVRRIKGGELPDRPQTAMCDMCDVSERCQTRVSLASKFF
jgi:CRISPR-associated exonuclease Cas4